MRYAGGILLQPVRKLVATIIFAPYGAKKADESPRVHHIRPIILIQKVSEWSVLFFEH